MPAPSRGRAAAAALLAVACAGGTGVAAQTAVMPHVGTAGVGADVATVVVSPRLGLRAGVNVPPIDIDVRSEGLDVTMGLPVQVVGALDLYPGGDLRLSAGAVWWPTDLTLGATPASSTVSIGSETYSAADVGRLDGVFAVAPVAPYLSLGVGRPGRRVGLYLDFGAAIRTSSEVRITATGPLAGDPAFEADLRVEEEDLRDEIGFFQVYPILAIGVSVTIR